MHLRDEFPNQNQTPPFMLRLHVILDEPRADKMVICFHGLLDFLYITWLVPRQTECWVLTGSSTKHWYCWCHYQLIGDSPCHCLYLNLIYHWRTFLHGGWPLITKILMTHDLGLVSYWMLSHWDIMWCDLGFQIIWVLVASFLIGIAIHISSLLK